MMTSNKNKVTDKRRSLPQVETKLKSYMELKKLDDKDILDKIKELYPNHPLSRQQLHAVKNGQVSNFKLLTLYRIMNATGLTPNDLLDWEKQVKDNG